MIRSLLFTLILPALTFGQSKEFEGEIHYWHAFQIKQESIDSMLLIQGLGRSSKYFYQKGSYKWTVDSSEVLEEYHDAVSNKTYFRYVNNDTLILSTASTDDTLLHYEIIENADTICGYVCNRLKVILGNKYNNSQFLYREISYTKMLAVDPEHFKAYKVYCSNEVYKITGAVPLRIEMSTSYWPFKISLEAVKVVQRHIDPKEIGLPPNAIVEKK